MKCDLRTTAQMESELRPLTILTEVSTICAQCSRNSKYLSNPYSKVTHDSLFINSRYFLASWSIMKVKSLSCVRLFVTLWTTACQDSLSVGFSRQEYWSGLPFPSPGDVPNPGMEPRSPALQADALPSCHQRSLGQPQFLPDNNDLVAFIFIKPELFSTVQS